MRRLAPELLVTAKTQRWSPEEFLRTLVEAEIASRDESNARERLKAAGFPVTKTIDEFDLAASSVKPATFDYLALARVDHRHGRTCASSAPPGPARATCSSPSATPPSTPANGSATSPPPSSSRPSTAASPTTASAASSRHILRADLILIDEIGFAPLDDTGAQLFFRLVAGAYERRSLGIGSHWPFEDWGRFIPEHTTAVSLLDRLLHHAVIVATDGESYRMKEARATERSTPNEEGLNYPEERGLLMATTGDCNLAIDIGRVALSGVGLGHCTQLRRSRP